MFETRFEERPGGPNRGGEGGTAESELVDGSDIRPAQSRLQAVNLGKKRIGNSGN
jgi:hypothetical protein